MLKDLVQKNRSYRRFYQDVKVDMQTLREFIDTARFTASARNMQSMRYILSYTDEKNSKIFQSLLWAAYLKDWNGPEEGEKPAAYIVILHDKHLSNNYFCDDGIVAQTILLAAVEKGLGGCMFSSINRNHLREDLNVPEQYEILHVLAIGKPKETVVIDPVKKDGDIRYWRDKDQVHHVPKRSLEDLIVEF
ncbi:MAG: nitroreductase family protein [Bacteroidales bacterium]|nr:nitroreductase family protein [Bacteroidales bacterium]